MKRLDIILHKRLDGIREELNAYIEENIIVKDTKKFVGKFLEGAIALNSNEDIYDDYDDYDDEWTAEEYVPDKKAPMFFVAQPMEARAINSIDEALENKSETFSSMLLRLIDEKGLKDSEVYKRANIDRRLFSKIRGDEDYVPSKKTAIAFCLALQLDLDEAKKLLEAAGYALSAASRFDLIIMYLIENREYNVHFANIVLADYGEGILSK